MLTVEKKLLLPFLFLVLLNGCNAATGSAGPTGPTGASGATGATGVSPFSLNGSVAYYSLGNVGIGTMSPSAALEVVGHIASGGNSPTVSCVNSGSGAGAPSISETATDARGVVNVGTNTSEIGACTITFSQSYGSPPVCVVSPVATVVFDVELAVLSTSTTNFVVGFPGTGYYFNNDGQFSYICMQ